MCCDRLIGVYHKGCINAVPGLILMPSYELFQFLGKETDEVDLQFQIFVLEHYHAAGQHVEILSQAVLSNNVSLASLKEF